MYLIKQKSEFGLNIFLNEDNKYIGFTFGGNGDLYWSIHSSDTSSDSFFIITKENYGVYILFEKLFSDIKNINIFDDYFSYEKETDEEIELQKKRYRLFNYSNYNELYDDKTNTITWYSDETAREVANYLKIKKEEDTFKLEFYIQPYIEGYDEDFHSSSYIPVRFRNSGSSYYPFNIIFMRMYNELKKVSDVNDIGHQIHIEEYLYFNQISLKK